MGAIYWVWRPGTVDDLGMCIGLLEPYRPLYGEEGWASLGDFLRFLLANRAVDFAIYRDGVIRGGPILAFDMFVFVSDVFVEETFSGPPFLVRTVLARFRENRLPILTPRGAYQAHTGTGLNLVHLFAWISLSGVDSEPFLLMDAAIESFMKRMRGLNCKRILAEAYGPVFTQWCVSGGYTIANDYGEFFRDHPELCLPEALRPVLMTATAEDARRNFGSRIAPVFRYVRPSLGFSDSEKAMLQIALGGDTDEELAQRLGISVWTVKKRWRLIYDRVTAIMPELLDSDPRDDTEDDKGRGAERRRHLLAFLRDHFEELCLVEQWPKLGQMGATLRR